MGEEKEDPLRRLKVELETATLERRSAVLAELVELKEQLEATVETERRRPRLSKGQEAARTAFAEEHGLEPEQLLPPTGRTVQSSPRFKPETMDIIEAMGRAVGLGSKTNTQRVLILAMMVKLGPPPGYEDDWDPSTLG